MRHKDFDASVRMIADARFDVFLQRFLSGCGADKSAITGFLRQHRIAKSRSLRKLVEVSRSAELAELTQWYQGWLVRAGFSPEGGGGPRYLMTMSEEERRALQMEMERCFPRLMAVRTETARKFWGWRSMKARFMNRKTTGCR
jgi:hypothetical protein